MPRTLRFFALASLIALVFSACASSKDTGFPEPTEEPTQTVEPTGEPTTPAPLEGSIDVFDNGFTPKDAIVKVGVPVVWEQSGTAPHTVTDSNGLYDSHADCSFSDAAKCLNQGDEFTRTFDEPGEYPYYCKLHGTPAGVGMAGTIIVEA